MFKFITNVFNTKEDYSASNIEVTLDIEPLSKEGLFDEAVKAVVERRIKDVVTKQMTEMCYTKEELEQTEAARAEHSKRKEPVTTLRAQYPKAIYYSSQYSYGFRAPFDLSRFIDRVIKDQL